MTEGRTYLDYNASAPMHDAARDAVLCALALSGNPSSVHAEGRAARALVETARAQVGQLVGAAAEDVTFTSGATEANALAIHGAIAAGHAARVVVSATEHPSVLDAARQCGAACEVVPVDGEGIVDLGALARILDADPAPALVCVMHANNETGAIQPIDDVVRIVREHGSLVHVDAVQTAGKMPLSLDGQGIDSLSVSGHKIGGPKGAGALATRAGLALAPMLHGGGQERRRRSGTENVPGIAGLGAAAETVLSQSKDMMRLAALRDRLETEAVAAAPGLVVLSGGVARLSNTSCLALPGARAETLVIALDLAGIAVSSGAACSSGKVGESHVLAAMGVDRSVADGAIRVSLGWRTTQEDVDRFVVAWRELVARRRTGNEIAA